MTIQQVSVPAETLAPTGSTNAYLVGDEAAILVDPANRTDDLDAAVASVSVEHVLVTHAHPDHVGAVAHYADSCDATVWARAGREERFERATGIAPDRTFREGTVIEDATVVETPGHAPDHVALAADGAMLTGDLVVSAGSVVVGADEGDVRAYLTSLRRLYARNPDELYPGHGPVIEDPRAEIERLIRHRLDRERKILGAVRDGATALDEILDFAYDKDLSGVRDLARTTTAAHLEKLAVEGKVAWDDERAKIAGSDE
ncbi:MBL fold metallo-hydrolase [Halorussus gelatinilyticus]|uniref:MBL fold metallo-hydrolase n=1 Tax=Halorussus gelatinilyticus TaxID=2937524 RepID=A0A8U0IDQ4_9EURY|nr:MBL fold metallo-hydrolase [Halorussus gelatinilyticus]UPV99179.1 MBL fold metallo-hydrolase [Halorussus gelatinilyticus]